MYSARSETPYCAPHPSRWEGLETPSHYNRDTLRNMKTATLPPVRIEPSLREEIEQSLEQNETLASLVKTAVRNEISRRKTQAEFVRRGMAAIERTAKASDGMSLDAVLGRLEHKLAQAKAQKKA